MVAYFNIIPMDPSETPTQQSITGALLGVIVALVALVLSAMGTCVPFIACIYCRSSHSRKQTAKRYVQCLYCDFLYRESCVIYRTMHMSMLLLTQQIVYHSCSTVIHHNIEVITIIYYYAVFVRVEAGLK